MRDARPALAFALFLAAAATSVHAAPSFVDVTVSAGVSYLQHTPVTAPNCIFGTFCEPDRMSGGVAVADVDGDGLLDLFVTRLDAPDILFQNLGTTFQDITVASGLAAYDLQSNGAGFADIDNDGDQDLYVNTLGEDPDPVNDRNYLFINNGSGVFTEEAISRGADITSTTIQRSLFSVAFGDYDRDGYLDMHTTKWHPFPLPQQRLLRNLGAGSPGYYEDKTAVAGVSMNTVYGFASSFTDLDQDGWPDLVVAADFETSRLYWNNGNGSFTNGTAAAGVGTDENGMGSTMGDFDGDGDLDWFVTSIFDADETCETASCNWGYTGNRLYRYEGGRVFSDATDAAGVREGFWGWGTAFFDYDNDGDLDLVMTNGVDFPGTSAETPFITDPMRMWENDGTGVFTEVSASVGLTDTGSGKGLVVFDYDDDGDLDLFIVNNASTPVLYRNDGGNANDWLRVETIGSLSNRDGIGAWVTVQAEAGGPEQVREIGSSTFFLGQSEKIAHFGLGQGTLPVHSVTVRWPSGIVQGFSNVTRNTTLVVDESLCTDGDSDGFCAGIDCDDIDPDTHPDAPEINDGLDNQCTGDAGFGLNDEISGVAGFHDSSNRDEFSWTEQEGATMYEVARSRVPTLATNCTIHTTADTFWDDSEIPFPSGRLFHYLVRTLSPNTGSWGADSAGTERNSVCP